MIPYHDYEGAEYEYPPHEEIELKPCPFCGCTSISMIEHRDYDGAFFVMCDSCGATLGTALDNMALTEEEITELWNTRVVEE